jgi:hypothetical protein
MFYEKYRAQRALSIGILIIKAGHSNEKIFPLSGKVFCHSGSSGKFLSKIFFCEKFFKLFR